jgi:hypothetical protein
LVFHSWLRSKQHIKKSELHDLLQGRTLFYVYIDWTILYGELYDKGRRPLNCARLQLVPKLPSTNFLNTVNLKTRKEELFLLCNNLSENIALFSCKRNIEFMCQQDILHMDGTFVFCTKFFGQFFTIHALCNEVYVWVVFCLLKNKSKSTHLRLFHLLKEKCDLMGCVLNPKTIVTGFEMAIHLSVEEVWQGVQSIGCRFHLVQSWYVLRFIFLFDLLSK